jgi:glutamyl-tRNA reductase
MRIEPGETYESWAKRVQQYEYGYALQQIAKGQDLNVVMEAMAARIQQKMLHPVLQSMREATVPIDVDASKKAYEEAYLKNNSPKPDHLVDD